MCLIAYMRTHNLVAHNLVNPYTTTQLRRLTAGLSIAVVIPVLTRGHHLMGKGKSKGCRQCNANTMLIQVRLQPMRPVNRDDYGMHE